MSYHRNEILERVQEYKPVICSCTAVRIQQRCHSDRRKKTKQTQTYTVLEKYHSDVLLANSKVAA